MAEKIHDPMLLGSAAIMHIGGIISSLFAMFLFESTLVSVIILGCLLLVDAIILYRCVKTMAEKGIVDP